MPMGQVMEEKEEVEAVVIVKVVVIVTAPEPSKKVAWITEGNRKF